MLVWMQCLFKSIGAMLVAADRTHFDALVKQLMKKELVPDSMERPAAPSQCPTSRATLYDYYFDAALGVWMAYDWIVPQYLHDAQLNYNDIFVPTADSVRINHILRQLRNVSKHRKYPKRDRQIVDALDSEKISNSL